MGVSAGIIPLTATFNLDGWVRLTARTWPAPTPQPIAKIQKAQICLLFSRSAVIAQNFLEDQLFFSYCTTSDRKRLSYDLI
jgi:hypothetical protein